MEHLNAKWTIGKDEDGFDCIITDEVQPWFVCQAITYLPGDDNGIETLRHICDVHNATLKHNAQISGCTPSAESGCSALHGRIAELENGLRQIAVWNQSDQDDHETCALQWRGCVAIARELLKPNTPHHQAE